MATLSEIIRWNNLLLEHTRRNVICSFLAILAFLILFFHWNLKIKLVSYPHLFTRLCFSRFYKFFWNYFPFSVKNRRFLTILKLSEHRADIPRFSQIKWHHTAPGKKGPVYLAQHNAPWTSHFDNIELSVLQD